METVSLLIMGLGVAALIAIFFISRLSRRDLPRRQDETIPNLRNQQGFDATSIAEDNAARDGKRPSTQAGNLSHIIENDTAVDYTLPNTAPLSLPPQVILFIAADIESGFAGENVLHALENCGLSFGEMDIYHRMILTEEGEAPLFSIANGVSPWTLVPEELIATHTPGLSLILNLPSPIDDKEALHDFLRTAERLTEVLGGVLKDQDQTPFTPALHQHYLNLVA